MRWRFNLNRRCLKYYEGSTPREGYFELNDFSYWFHSSIDFTLVLLSCKLWLTHTLINTRKLSLHVLIHLLGGFVSEWLLGVHRGLICLQTVDSEKTNPRLDFWTRDVRPSKCLTLLTAQTNRHNLSFIVLLLSQKDLLQKYSSLYCLFYLYEDVPFFIVLDPDKGSYPDYLFTTFSLKFIPDVTGVIL